ncbi:MAG: helix-turn-helix transcriptional regulator [Pseudomonadota bacterium]
MALTKPAKTLADARIGQLVQEVGRRVKRERNARRMSRRELSERSGVSHRYLATCEAGQGNISIALLHKLAVALDKPVEWFLVDYGPHSDEVRKVTDLYYRADATKRARVLEILDPEWANADKAQRVCLVGLRGAGKSTLGAYLASYFEAPMVELNSEIERAAGMPVGEIIALYGQGGYRELEADTLLNIVATHSRAVVAVAGGIVAESKTYANVLSRFHTVWLKAAPEEHMERVRAQGDTRPMAGNPHAMSQLHQILEDREPLYARADHCLDTSGHTTEHSSLELAKLIGKLGVLGQAAA